MIDRTKLTTEEDGFIKVLPCPFCGGYGDIQSGMGEYWVRCAICLASSQMCNTEYHAIEAWNKRQMKP